MRIAVLSEPSNFHTQKWAKALQAAGADVYIFSFSDYQLDRIPCIKIDPGIALTGRLTYASYLYTGEKLRKALEQYAIDIVNPINVTPFGVWAAKADYHPIVSIAMGADILEYPPDNIPSKIPTSRLWSSNDFVLPGPLKKVAHGVKSRIFRNQVKEALEKSELVTGDNLELVHAVQNWFDVPAEKVKLNRWGIEEELFQTTPEKLSFLRRKYQIKNWQKVVLSPRGMKPVYQGDIILEAFELLLRRGVRDLKMIMLSAGYDIPPEIDRKALELAQVFPNFHYERSLVPREEMCELWSLVDMFISVPVYDGYSNSLSEGRYAGAIPIVNDIPAHRELIEHEVNAWVVDPLTAPNLADNILQVFSNLKDLKDRFREPNRQWIESNASLKTNIRNFLKDCESLLNKESHIS